MPEGIADGRWHRIEVVSADDGQVLSEGQKLVKIDQPWVPYNPSRPATFGDSAETVSGCYLLRPDATPLVSVVVLNRNGEAVLSAFLASWARYNTSRVEIIIVDHASTDGSCEMVKRWQGQLDVKLIELDYNGSFSASCNLGAQRARGDYLLFMNNDIVWLHDALPRMLQSLQNPEVGIVGMKLLKVVGESTHALQPATEVQHLGVRFKLNDRGYWPFEVSPGALQRDAEYAPQVVPAVTGATLLCRKRDFEQIGGFHTDYFYGFEDVELCLRLSHRLRKVVLSHNDLCALHHHGHTRLSGRDMSLFDRVQHNSIVLESHLGLWLKQAYWRSLLQGDGYMTTEALTIGLVVDGDPYGETSTPLTCEAVAFAEQLSMALPHAQIVFLPPDRGWKNATDLHVLVVGTPRYDISAVHNARPDLLTVAWLRSDAALWSTVPWWLDFGGYLATSVSASKRGAFAGVRQAARAPDAPLGALLDTRRWRLRVALHVPVSATELNAATPVANEAHSLMIALKGAGLPCWQVPLEQWSSHPCMADICITLQGTALVPQWAPRSDLLNVLWLVEAGAKAPKDWAPRHGHITSERPTAKWLEQAMEEAVGNTFHPS
jgi:GT2 family glycosyltransferase